MAMDSLDTPVQEEAPHRPYTFSAVDQAERPLSLIEFEQRLYRLCARTDPDNVFWSQVARDVTALQAGMNAAEICKCEASVDCLLAKLGLPAWTIIKARRHPR